MHFCLKVTGDALSGVFAPAPTGEYVSSFGPLGETLTDVHAVILLAFVLFLGVCCSFWGRDLAEVIELILDDFSLELLCVCMLYVCCVCMVVLCVCMCVYVCVVIFCVYLCMCLCGCVCGVRGNNVRGMYKCLCLRRKTTKVFEKQDVDDNLCVSLVTAGPCSP